MTDFEQSKNLSIKREIRKFKEKRVLIPEKNLQLLQQQNALRRSKLKSNSTSQISDIMSAIPPGKAAIDSKYRNNNIQSKVTYQQQTQIQSHPQKVSSPIKSASKTTTTTTTTTIISTSSAIAASITDPSTTSVINTPISSTLTNEFEPKMHSQSQFSITTEFMDTEFTQISSDEQINSQPLIEVVQVHDDYHPNIKRTLAARDTSSEDEGNENDYKIPKKTLPLSRLSQMIKPKNPPVTTVNRFVPLIEDDIHVVEEPHHHEVSKENTASSSVIGKPPPIVINGIVGDLKGFRDEIKSVVENDFFLKYTKNSTLLFLKDKTDYNKLSNKLKALNELEWHTYTVAEEKQHAFVLRGLDFDVDLKDIKEQLEEEHKITTNNIYKMSTTGRPLYLVTTSNKINLNFLVNNIKHLMNTRVYWERRRNERKLIQCRRCQRWGHATSNCYRVPRCLKCANNHWTRECEKTPDTPAKCANCNMDHPANYSKCPEYTKALELLESKKPTFKPAPPPVTNAWQNRSKKTVQFEPAIRMATEFPPLPSKTTANRAAPHFVSGMEQDIGTFTELASEFKVLNNMVNLKVLLQAVRDLNAIMSSAPNSSAKFIAFYNFISSIEKYNI